MDSVNLTSSNETLPPSPLLEALSQAFSYPALGLGTTLEALQAFQETGDLSDETRSRIAKVLRESHNFVDLTAEQLSYTRLFIGSLKMEAPPYASYYLEEGQLLYGQTAVEVESIYGQFGIQLDEKEIAPPDHLRYLLAFLALLAKRYEKTKDGAFVEAFFDFRNEYVLSWIKQCKNLVDQHAENSYYPVLMDLIIFVLES